MKCINCKKSQITFRFLHTQFVFCCTRRGKEDYYEFVIGERMLEYWYDPVTFLEKMKDFIKKIESFEKKECKYKEE